MRWVQGALCQAVDACSCFGARKASNTPHLTFQDPGGSLSALIRSRTVDSAGQFYRYRSLPPGTFDERVAVGETPFDQGNWLSVGYTSLTLNP